MTNNEKVKKAQDGDTEIRNELLQHYGYIIQWVCNKFRDMPFDKDTIRYGATMGLIKAIENFNPDKGEFNRYAYLCARYIAQNEMYKDWVIQVPIEKLLLSLKDGEIPYKLTNQFKVEKQYKGKTVYYSPPELVYYDTHKDNDMYIIINNVLNTLKTIEKDCILYKYGRSGQTLKTLGKKHKLTCERIRQYIAPSFDKFQKRVKEELRKQENENYQKSS